MGREFELKYRATEAQIGTIREKYGNFTPITMETTYYDTPAGDLSRLRWTLRRRMENGISVCTVKTPAPGGGRGEWEIQCGNILDAIGELCKLGAPEELAELTSGGVTAVCGARFTRLAKTLDAEGCTVELALDRGILLGGGKELPFAEVEAELKAGSEEAAKEFAAALAAEFGLVPERKSKYRRASELAEEG